MTIQIDQEPINRSLYLLYYALESTLSRVDLFIERLSGEVSHARSSKTQSKQSLIERIVLRHIHDLALYRSSCLWPGSWIDIIALFRIYTGLIILAVKNISNSL